MSDQTCDVAVNGSFEHCVVPIRADVVSQLADEIAKIRREPRLQLDIAASALDYALKVAQRPCVRLRLQGSRSQ